MAKRKDSAATAVAEPETGASPERFPSESSDADKHAAIAEVAEEALGRPVETPTDQAAPAADAKPDEGPHVQESPEVSDKPTPKPRASNGRFTKAEEDAAAEKADQADEEPAAEPLLNKRQVATAKQLGYSGDEIADMDPDQWGEMLDRAGKGLNRKYSELGKLEQELKTQRPAAEPSEDEEDQTTDASTARDEDEDLGFDYSDEDYREGEDTAKRNRHLAVSRSNMLAIDRLQDQVDELVQERRNETANRFFAGLDQDVFSDFGEGDFDELGSNSPEAKARVSLVKEAVNIHAYFANRGEPVSMTEALDRALHYNYAEDIQAAERRRLTKEAKRRAKLRSPRPTDRHTVPLPATDETGRHAQIAAVAAKHGVNLAQSR